MLLSLPALPRSRPDTAAEGGASHGFDGACAVDSAAKDEALCREMLSCRSCCSFLEVPVLEAAALSSASGKLLAAVTEFAVEEMAARVAARPDRVRS